MLDDASDRIEQVSVPWPSCMKASMLWHGAMTVGLVADPAHFAWWAGGVATNHLALSAASMLPRSALLGPNITRLSTHARERNQVCLTFDDGPDPFVTPQVLDLLEDAGAYASFFCVGERLERFPQLARRIIELGHTIENHTQTHSHRFAFRGTQGLLTEIRNAQISAWNVTGTHPSFFRAPAGMRNPWLQPVLAHLGLRLVSWTRRGFDTVQVKPEPVFKRLAHNLAGGDILLLHDGHGARMRSDQPVILQVLPALLARLDALSLRSVSLNAAFDESPS